MQNLYKTWDYYEFAKMIIGYDDRILNDLDRIIEELLKLTNNIVKRG